jgi:uncharacterized protein with von Willebrand factor type A (vWA) domain
MNAALRPLPSGARPFVAFARLLHTQGFPVATEQTIAFLRSIALLGPRSLGDVRHAAFATFAPPPDRQSEFAALFDGFFRDDGATALTVESAEEEEETAVESDAAPLEPMAAEEANESGAAATEAEALSLRRFEALGDSRRLALLRRSLPAAMPRRRAFRREPARRGDRLDLRKSLADMVHGNGAARPEWTRRRTRLRRVLLLIDISGSMKAHTEDYLRFAHALTQALPSVETFSFGTRLTRLTRSLAHRDLGRALAEIAPSVADWNGGTRIGESIAGLLAIPRFSRASRGALTIVLSDGLERGDPAAMIAAVRRLAGRSWRLAWLTPLAADPDFRVETEALKAILPIVDHLGDGSGLVPLCEFMEGSAGLGRSLPAAGRRGTKGHGNTDHRRPSPHLAAKRPALAERADGAAHLRTL